MSMLKSFPRLQERDAQELLGRLLAETESTEAVSVEARSRVVMPPIAARHVRIESELLDRVEASVEDACRRFGYPGLASQDFDASECDAAVGEALHRSLPPGGDMTYAEAADPRVWSAIALCRLANYIRWRWFGRLGAAGDRVRRSRHMIGRLWWRADRAFDQGRAGGDYALLGIPENLWNQLEERTLFFTERELVRAVLARVHSSSVTRDQLSGAVLVIRARIATGNLHVLTPEERDLLVDDAFAVARSQRPSRASSS
jgi:hypothetical protein